jgi:glycosyltransferase involved in cell wall biosynthesis
MSENKKTIIVFSCFYEPYISGAERFVKEVVERLASRFNFIIIASKLDRQSKYWETKSLADGSEYKILRIGFGFKFDKWLYPILAPIAALFFVPQIVHAVMESYAGIALLFHCFIVSLLNLKTKTILTLQSGDLDEKAAKGLFPFWLWRKIHTSPDYIMAISSYLKNRAIKLGVPENEISVIPNGVDLKTVFSFQPSAFNRIPHRIVCVARLSPEKGLEYLLDALPLVKREFSDAHLVLVGGGILENDLRKQADQLGISDSVFFLGAQPHVKAIEEMRRAEAFVCPSLAEGLGIVFIEAQAVGVPVVGTNVGGISDVIKDSETGLLVPPRNSRAIADAVIKIFKDKELAKKMTEEAKSQIGRFDWDKIARQVSDLYESIQK